MLNQSNKFFTISPGSHVGDHAVTLIHYEGRLSDIVLFVYADSCLVSVFFVADAGELFIYTTPLTRWLVLFAEWVTGWSSIQLVIVSIWHKSTFGLSTTTGRQKQLSIKLHGKSTVG